jgi:hypothetical protein
MSISHGHGRRANGGGTGGAAMGSASVTTRLFALLHVLPACCRNLTGGSIFFREINKLAIKPGLVPSNFQKKVYKISRHIESLDACIEH